MISALVVVCVQYFGLLAMGSWPRKFENYCSGQCTISWFCVPQDTCNRS